MMEHERLKSAAKVSLLMLTLLLIGAVVFYRERIFSDSAYIAVKIINSGKLQIQHGRYGSFITQIFPLIAVKLHLPLKEVLISYSVSFNIFYLGTALFLYRLKDYPLVILMGLFYSLFVTETYYWTNNELQQAVCWSLMSYGILKYMANTIHANRLAYRLATFLTFCVLAFLSISTHPAAIFPFTFLWVYYWIEQKQRPFNSKWALLYFGTIVIIWACGLISISNNSYNNGVTSHLWGTSVGDLLQAFVSGVANQFWKSISTQNWLLPIFFIISMITLLRQKKYLLFSWVLLANIGYFVIVCITFMADVDYYIESELLPLTILGTTTFVYYVLPRIPKTRNITFLLGIVFLIRACFILYTSRNFIARVDRMEEVASFMKKENINKMILLREDDRFEHESMNTGWGVCHESMLQSALKGDPVTATFVYLTQEGIDKMPSSDSLKDIRTTWNVWPRSDWNKAYFKPDSLHPYVVKRYEEVFRR